LSLLHARHLTHPNLLYTERHTMSRQALIGEPDAEKGHAALNFTLPTELEASEPPEARGLTRDGVRLMVSYRADNRIIHTRFYNVGDFLRPGDVLAVNTSGTLNAALDVTRADGTPLELHLSTHLDADRWTVELRQHTPGGTLPWRSGRSGETLNPPGAAQATFLAPQPPSPCTGTSHSRASPPP